MSLSVVATNEQLEGLPFQLFLWIAAPGGSISARDVQVFSRMLENCSWCQSQWARESLFRTRERYAAVWNVEALSRMKRDIEQLHAGLRYLRESLAPGEVAAARTDLQRLAEATARASGGILGPGGLRRERRDSLLVFSALADAIFLTTPEGSSPTGGPPTAGAARPGSPARSRRRVRCVQVIDETADVRTFRFAPVVVAPTRFEYLPGQFVTVEIEAEGEVLKRSYTIASSPTRPDVLEITIKRVPGGRVSNWLHDHLRVGDEVTLAGPAGKFSCEIGPKAEKLLFISGGSGITPVMSMSRFLHDNADPRDVVFLYSARNEADLIFKDELALIAARSGHFRTVFTLTNAHADWRGFRGRISPQLIEDGVPDFRQRTVFLCGPNPFMETVRAALTAAGFPMVNFNAESFGGARPPGPAPAAAAGPRTNGAEPPSESASAASPGAPADSRARVERPRRSSHLLGVLPRPRFTVVSDQGPVSASPANAPNDDAAGAGASARGAIVFSTSGREARECASETILEAAEGLGLTLPSACRSGVCGTCKVRKVSGSVKMDCEDGLDASDREAGFILACTAHAVDRVVVEA